MTSEFIPKRPHKKSRGGCQTCKTKKIKCDEAQPKCSFCEKRKLTCSYVIRPMKSSTSSSDSSPDYSSATTPENSYGEEDETYWRGPYSQTTVAFTAGLSPDQLRLMHHWSTMTFNKIAWRGTAKSVLQEKIPQLAFDNDFLLNGLLGISSLHMQQLVPHPEYYRKQTELYRAKTLSGFRRALTQVKPRTREYEAVLAMALLLVILYSRDSVTDPGELTVMKWLILYRGLSAIIMIDPANFAVVKELEVGGLLQREYVPLTIGPMVPKILVKLLQDIPASDPDYAQLQSYCQVLDSLGILYAGLKQDGLGDNFYVRLTAWPSYGTQEFTNSAKEGRPRALIILAYYLVFLKLVKQLWWLDGVGDRDLKTLIGLLDREWYPYLEVPLQAMTMTDAEEIMKLLLA